MGYEKSSKLEKIHIPQRTFMEVSVQTGKRTDSRRKGERQSPSSTLTPTNSFGNDPEEEEPHDDFTDHRKHFMLPNGSLTKMPKTGTRLSKAKDQGLEFWQTKSFAIMTYATIPGDCIDRVTSEQWRTSKFRKA